MRQAERKAQRMRSIVKQLRCVIEDHTHVYNDNDDDDDDGEKAKKAKKEAASSQKKKKTAQKKMAPPRNTHALARAGRKRGAAARCADAASQAVLLSRFASHGREMLDARRELLEV